MSAKAVAAIVALIAIWFFFLRKSATAAAAAQLGTSGSTTLGIAELYFDPGVNFPADIQPNLATP